MLILEGGGEGKLRGLAKSVISDGTCREECIDHIKVTSHTWLAILCYNYHSTFIVGGAVASWLVCSTPERAVRV